MKGFLETYGVAIFTIVLVAILIAFAGPLGMKIKNATTDKVCQTEEIGKDEIQNSVNSKEEEKCEAFAVYSADDNSISFYKRETLPNIGDEFEGKTVTKIYTNIETTQYRLQNPPGWLEYVGVLDNLSYDVVDKIQPINTVGYFAGAKEIHNIQNLDTSNVTDMSYMFYACPSLTALDVSKFNTSNVTDMSHMFNGCPSLTALDVSKFNTSNVTTMSYMFYNCSSLTSLDLSKFNTSNVITMSSMFEYCQSLTSLDLSKFDTSKVTDMTGMFRHCEALTSLDLSKFNTSKVTDMTIMFDNCQSLTSLDVSSFDTSKVTDVNSMFYKCSSLKSNSVKISQKSFNKLIEEKYLGCSHDVFNIVK